MRAMKVFYTKNDYEAENPASASFFILFTRRLPNADPIRRDPLFTRQYVKSNELLLSVAEYFEKNTAI